MKRKKIAFVVSSILTARFFLPYHIEKLSKEYDVYLIGNFSKEDIETIKEYKLTGIKPIKIIRRINLFVDFLSLIALTRYYRKMQFDAVHSLAPKAGLINVTAGFLAGIKNRIHIFTGQVWHTKKGFFRLFLKLFDKIIVLFSTKILIDGKSQQKYLIEQGIVTNKKSLVLGKGSISGVNLKSFYPNKDVRIELRKKYKIGDETTVFLFLGRINKDKGVLDLAHAFKELLQTHSNILLFMVGYDEENLIPEMEEITGLNENFIYAGSTMKPENLFQVGDVFVLPSYREGFGTSVIEASSCKLAVIVSDTYGLQDAVLDKNTGLKHKVGAVKDLKEKMEVFITKPELIKIFGQNGFNYVLENFSADYVSNQWLAFYKNILG